MQHEYTSTQGFVFQVSYADPRSTSTPWYALGSLSFATTTGGSLRGARASVSARHADEQCPRNTTTAVRPMPRWHAAQRTLGILLGRLENEIGTRSSAFRFRADATKQKMRFLVSDGTVMGILDASAGESGGSSALTARRPLVSRPLQRVEDCDQSRAVEPLHVGRVLGKGAYGAVVACVAGGVLKALKIMRLSGDDEDDVGAIARELVFLLTHTPSRPDHDVVFDAATKNMTDDMCIGVTMPPSALTLASAHWGVEHAAFESGFDLALREADKMTVSPKNVKEYAAVVDVAQERADTFQSHTVPSDVLHAVGGSLLTQLEQLHARGVTHGDVKPANVLLMVSDGKGGPVVAEACSWTEQWAGRSVSACAECSHAARWRARTPARFHAAAALQASQHGVYVRLIDGSLSTLSATPMTRTAVTLWWRPPELIACANGCASRCSCTQRLGPQSDVWSWGVIMLEAATGRVLTRHMDAKSARASALRRLPSLLASIVDEGLRDMLGAALRADPKARADAATLLEHPWWFTRSDSDRGVRWLDRVVAHQNARVASMQVHELGAARALTLSRAPLFATSLETLNVGNHRSLRMLMLHASDCTDERRRRVAGDARVALLAMDLWDAGSATVLRAAQAQTTAQGAVATQGSALQDGSATMCGVAACLFFARACLGSQQSTVEWTWSDAREAMAAFTTVHADDFLLRTHRAAFFAALLALLGVAPAVLAGAADGACGSATPLHMWGALVAARLGAHAGGNEWTDADAEARPRTAEAEAATDRVVAFLTALALLRAELAPTPRLAAYAAMRGCATSAANASFVAAALRSVGLAPPPDVSRVVLDVWDAEHTRTLEAVLRQRLDGIRTNVRFARWARAEWGA